MRTIEELQKVLSPNGERNSKWTYVPVLKSYTVDENIYTYVELHAVYFTEDGKFMGINKNVETPYGDDLEELKESLQRMLRACENPIISEEEMNLIFNS